MVLVDLNLKLHGDVVVGVRVVRNDLFNFANIETHEFHLVANLQARAARNAGSVGDLLKKPAFALGGFVKVIAEAKKEQRGGKHDEPTDGAFHAAEARAELRGKVLQS